MNMGDAAIKVFRRWYESVRHNHLLMMLICCALPLLLLFVAVSIFSLSNSYLYWSVLLLCPLMHFFMMKHMHSDKKDGKDKKGGEDKK